MSRWTAYLIAAAVAGAFSIPAITPAAAGAHARGPVAAPMSYGARPMHRPPAAAPRPAFHGHGAHGPRHVASHGGRWQGRHGVAHAGFGRPAHRHHGHHGRNGMLGYGAAGFASVYTPPALAYATGYAEPPLQWTHAEPDLAPCVRPLVIQIGAPVYNRPVPRVTYGAPGCGAPQVVRYVVGPRVVDVASDSESRGAVVRARH